MRLEGLHKARPFLETVPTSKKRLVSQIELISRDNANKVEAYHKPKSEHIIIPRDATRKIDSKVFEGPCLEKQSRTRQDRKPRDNNNKKHTMASYLNTMIFCLLLTRGHEKWLKMGIVGNLVFQCLENMFILGLWFSLVLFLGPPRFCLVSRSKLMFVAED